MASELGVQTIQHTNGTDALTIDSSGVVTLSDVGLGQFYKEGLWTPAIEGATSAGTATYTQQKGSYRKIGSMVHLTCYVAWSGHTGTGTLKITGIPYDTAAGDPQFSHVTAGAIMQDSIDLDSNARSVAVYAQDNSDHLQVYETKDNEGWRLQPMDAAGSIIFGIIYVTDDTA